MNIEFKTEAGRLFFRHLLECFFHERWENFNLTAEISQGVARVTLEENGEVNHGEAF